MNIEELRLHALSLPEVEEGFPFGEEALVFKVDGKMFLLVMMNRQPLQFNVKCDPERAIELREEYESVLPGYHMNKKHWNTVIADRALPNSMIKQFVTDSYNLVCKKKKK